MSSVRCTFRLIVGVAVFLVVVILNSGISSTMAQDGFRDLFNGKDLTGWHGMPHFSPIKLAEMSQSERDAKLAEWTEDAKKHWRVENGELINDGHGAYLVTDEQFTDYELVIDYKTVALADSGIYLKGTPQVQIWDYTDKAKFPDRKSVV